MMSNNDNVSTNDNDDNDFTNRCSGDGSSNSSSHSNSDDPLQQMNVLEYSYVDMNAIIHDLTSDHDHSSDHNHDTDRASNKGGGSGIGIGIGIGISGGGNITTRMKTEEDDHNDNDDNSDNDDGSDIDLCDNDDDTENVAEDFADDVAEDDDFDVNQDETDRLLSPEPTITTTTQGVIVVSHNNLQDHGSSPTINSSRQQQQQQRQRSSMSSSGSLSPQRQRRTSHVSNTTSENGNGTMNNTNNEHYLGSDETILVTYLKSWVQYFIIICGCCCMIGMYVIQFTSQHTMFHEIIQQNQIIFKQQFHTYIPQYLQPSLTNFIDHYHDDETLTSSISNTNTSLTNTWPFVTLHHFQQRANNFLELNQHIPLAMMILPIVTTTNQIEYENYTQQHYLDWLQVQEKELNIMNTNTNLMTFNNTITNTNTNVHGKQTVTTTISTSGMQSSYLRSNHQNVIRTATEVVAAVATSTTTTTTTTTQRKKQRKFFRKLVHAVNPSSSSLLDNRIHSYLYNYTSNHDEPVMGMGPFLPVWQIVLYHNDSLNTDENETTTSNINLMKNLINVDSMTIPGYEPILTNMLLLKQQQQGNINNKKVVAGPYTTILESKDDHDMDDSDKQQQQEQSPFLEPLSTFFYPITTTRVNNNTYTNTRMQYEDESVDGEDEVVVAVLSVLVSWKSFFTNRIQPMIDADTSSSYSKGGWKFIIVVEQVIVTNPDDPTKDPNLLYNNNYKYLTYSVDGEGVQFVGVGDIHSKQMNHHGYTISSFLSVPTDQPDADATWIDYNLHVYPSKHMYSAYITYQPVWYSLLVFVLFMILYLLFIMYDWFVEQRQKVIMDHAIRTSLILSSLFPESVRDRLFGSTVVAPPPPQSIRNSTIGNSTNTLPLLQNGQRNDTEYDDDDDDDDDLNSGIGIGGGGGGGGSTHTRASPSPPQRSSTDSSALSVINESLRQLLIGVGSSSDHNQNHHDSRNSIQNHNSSSARGGTIPRLLNNLSGGGSSTKAVGSSSSNTNNNNNNSNPNHNLHHSNNRRRRSDSYQDEIPIPSPNSKPIADLFPRCTVLFADIAGFTAWSSLRDPSQVFVLLESVYHAFDTIARKRCVFKVETIGDSYVAVTGCPDEQDDHALIMVRFARDCRIQFKYVTQKLELTLGPDTGDLMMRFGLNSGPVTAGVLRGEKSRFQLFGDTVNTAARMESTGERDRIQLSQSTADILTECNKKHWIKPRTELVYAKGKGNLQTYWFEPESNTTNTSSSSSSRAAASLALQVVGMKAAEKMKQKLLKRTACTDIAEEEEEEDSGEIRSPCSKTSSRSSSLSSSSPMKKIGEKKSIWGINSELCPDEVMYLNRHQRLIDYNVDLLSSLLRRVVAQRLAKANCDRRASLAASSSAKWRSKITTCHDGNDGGTENGGDLNNGGTCILDEVQEVIRLPNFDSCAFKEPIDPDTITLPYDVSMQLKKFVTVTASLYRTNPFHNFEHASHVTMSVNKLLQRVVAPSRTSEISAAASPTLSLNGGRRNSLRSSSIGNGFIQNDRASQLNQSCHSGMVQKERNNSFNDFHTTSIRHQRKQASDLHNYTYGITSDPLTQFAIVFGALIHDCDHWGVSNAQLIKEEASMATKYNNKSIAEQNSFELAWNILLDAEEYKELQSYIFQTESEYIRFRQVVINVVMATDIFDTELCELRDNRWNKAFSNTALSNSHLTRVPSSNSINHDSTNEVEIDIDEENRKATIVIEHIMQASDVAHTMQHWHIYQKWNRRLFDELYTAYRAGRMLSDPSIWWYSGELKFFDTYVIPLAKKLKDCNVFGVSSDECLTYAENNRNEWEMKGKQIVNELVSNFLQRETEELQQMTQLAETRGKRRRFARRRSLITTGG